MTGFHQLAIAVVIIATVLVRFVFLAADIRTLRDTITTITVDTIVPSTSLMVTQTRASHLVGDMRHPRHGWGTETPHICITLISIIAAFVVVCTIS